MANNKEIEKLLAEAESSKIRELKADNLRLLRQLEKAKNKKADMVEAVYEAVATNLRTWDKPKIPKPKVPDLTTGVYRRFLMKYLVFQLREQASENKKFLIKHQLICLH